MSTTSSPQSCDAERASLWSRVHPDLDGDVAVSSTPAAPLPDHVDVVVVGAGLVGLSTAVMLAERGASVCVLESRHIGAGTTGHSTAKVSLLQGTRLSQILRRQGRERGTAYVAGNRAGQSWLLARADELGVAHQTRAAVTYADVESEVATAEEELTAATALGLDVTWREPDDVGREVSFPFAGGVALAGQAQLDPLAMLLALADRARALGVSIHEHTRATAALRGRVTTPAGEVTGEHVVVASGIPFTDSGGFFARVEPHRSYALALELPDGRVPPLDMHLSTGSPSRSVRDAVLPGGRAALVVGGNGHVVGRSTSERGAVADLTAWAQRYFPGLPLIASWSAQDYTPVDQLPFVGPLLPLGERTLVATGFGKWGMAAAPAAATVLTATITGEAAPDWAEAFGSWEGHEARGITTAISTNLGVAARLVGDRVRTVGEPTGAAWAGDAAAPSDTASDPGPDSASAEPSTGDPVEGAGWTTGGPLRPVAVSTVGGRTRRVSAVCPHLGGVLRWNDAECTWDCPLHGSRFEPDGTLLEGPATHDLTPRETETS